MAKKHIELHYSSLAECYAKVRELLYISDLCHEAWVTIDIDTDSAFDGSFLKVADYSDKIGN
jgi:hypothetical protein